MIKEDCKTLNEIGEGNGRF